MDEEDIIVILQNAFTNDEIKQQVLTPYWYNLNKEIGIDSIGFCFSASEILYRLTGGTNIWQIRFLSNPAHWNYWSHYFLKRKVDNQIVDITANQYTERGITIPYNIATGRGLPQVSIQARILAKLSGLGEIYKKSPKN